MHHMASQHLPTVTLNSSNPKSFSELNRSDILTQRKRVSWEMKLRGISTHRCHEFRTQYTACILRGGVQTYNFPYTCIPISKAFEVWAGRRKDYFESVVWTPWFSVPWMPLELSGLLSSTGQILKPAGKISLCGISNVNKSKQGYW